MTESMIIRVLLVDDHQLLRSGLAFSLKGYPDVRVVGEASDGAEAIQKCAELEPDVVLMDLIMPGMNGTAAIRLIRENYPQVKVLALTSFDDEELVQTSLQAGAMGYLLKNISSLELVAAIRHAYAGKSTLSPEAAQVLINLTQKRPNDDYGLSEREREVLAWMTQGRSNQEIALQMSVSVSTVKRNVSDILSRLRVANRAEAVAFALQRKLN